MKKIALVAALVVMGGTLFAQGAGPMGQGRGMGPGAPAAIDWKVGTTVTSEYKKATGQISSSTTLWGATMTFKADNVEYQLFLPRVTELASLKGGETITIEGVFKTVKSDTKVPPTVHPFKVTVNGKEVDLTANNNMMGRGQMDRGQMDRGPMDNGMGGRGRR